MKNNLKEILIILLLIIIQISFINNGVLFNLYPNLLLIVTIFLSQKKGKKHGAILGLILGLLYDVLASPNFGIKGLSFMVVAYIIGIFSEYIFEESIWTAIFYTTLGKFIYELVQSIVYFFLSYSVKFTDIFKNTFNVELIISILIFYLIQYFYKTEKNDYELKKD